jgi:hypothetical protein
MVSWAKKKPQRQRGHIPVGPGQRKADHVTHHSSGYLIAEPTSSSSLGSSSMHRGAMAASRHLSLPGRGTSPIGPDGFSSCSSQLISLIFPCPYAWDVPPGKPRPRPHAVMLRNSGPERSKSGLVNRASFRAGGHEPLHDALANVDDQAAIAVPDVSGCPAEWYLSRTVALGLDA